MKKILEKLKKIKPTKRKLVQLYAALLFNANLKGFVNGKIYQGALKNVCTPGLNCYSCPGASGACPLGSLQNSLGSAEKSSIRYVVGILLLYSILFGRMICGWLCPFGWIQELLYKIKTPKLKKNRITKILSYFKYVLLVYLVVIVPVLYALRNVTLPAFCKYICPAGTLEGAIGLLSNKVNAGEFARLGPLFTWKFILMVSIVVGSVFIFRLFCRFLCPLGALYGLFNKIAILGIKLEKPKCVNCGLCISKCQMDISHVGDHECINCGECVEVCPTNAIRWRGSKIILPPNEVPSISPDMSEDERIECEKNTEKRNRKLAKRRLITRIVAAVTMISVLVFALVYYNFIDKDEALIIYQQYDECPAFDIPIFDGEDYTGNFNLASNKGRVTVINFWGFWCTGCKAELPDFDRVATDLAESVTVIAIHSSIQSAKEEFDSDNYINEEFPDTEILFGLDRPINENDIGKGDYFYTSLGGTGTYPITVIVDPSGEIFFMHTGEMDYNFLRMMCEAAASNS